MGCNAIRCAHNPPSETFLDLCDKYGMLIINEAFDEWKRTKTGGGYSVYFEEWWEKDLTAMLLRDRNHPSIIMWSIGNEIPEQEMDWIQTAARQISLSIQNVQLYDTNRKRISELSGLREIDQSINLHQPLTSTLFVILSLIQYQLGFDAAEILLYDADENKLVW